MNAVRTASPWSPPRRTAYRAAVAFILLVSGIARAAVAADGDLLWARRAGGTGMDAAQGVGAFADGSCVSAGFFQGWAEFGRGGGSLAIGLNSRGKHDIFAARYHVDGSLAWAAQAGGPEMDVAYAAAACADGTSVVTGEFAGRSIFGPRMGETLTARGQADAFIAKYSAWGALLWVRTAGGTGCDCGNAVAPLQGGSCVVTGSFQGNARFGPLGPSLTARGDGDVFIVKYSGAGVPLWATQVGVSGAGEGYGVAAYPDGSCAVTGSFTGSATFGPNTTLTASGGDDIFIAKYDPRGRLAWARRAGGSGDDSGYGIAASRDGSCTVTGDFAGWAEFGGGEPEPVGLSSSGQSAIFVAHYAADGALEWAVSAGGSGYLNAGYGAASLPDGTVAVTGTFQGGGAMFGDGDDAVRLAAAAVDIFVAKYAEEDGGLVWALGHAGSTSLHYGNAIAGFPDLSCVAAGAFDRRAAFEPGSAFVPLGGSDASLARYSGSYSVSGKVRYDDDRGVKGAQVGLEGVTTVGPVRAMRVIDCNPIHARDGYYEFKNLPEGKYVVTVALPGVSPARAEYIFAPGGARHLYAPLEQDYINQDFVARRSRL